MVNVLPISGALSTITVPPWASTMRRVMARPRPRPSNPRCKDRLICTNPSQMCSCSSSGMPGPKSCTLISTLSGYTLPERITGARGGLKRMALSRRLTIASDSRSPSSISLGNHSGRQSSNSTSFR